MLESILTEYRRMNNIFLRLKKVDFLVLFLIIIVLYIWNLYLIGFKGIYVLSLIGPFAIGFISIIYLVSRINFILWKEDNINKGTWLLWNKQKFREGNNKYIINYLDHSYGISTVEDKERLISLLYKDAEDIKIPNYLKRVVFVGAFIPIYIKNIDIVFSAFTVDPSMLLTINLMLIVFIFMGFFVINSMLNFSVGKYFSTRNLAKAIEESLFVKNGRKS